MPHKIVGAGLRRLAKELSMQDNPPTMMPRSGGPGSTQETTAHPADGIVVESVNGSGDVSLTSGNYSTLHEFEAAEVVLHGEPMRLHKIGRWSF